MMRSPYSGTTAVRFHTQRLSSAEADRLHARLGELPAALDVWLGGEDGTAWVGAIALADASVAGIERLLERVRAEPLIDPITIAVGRYP